MSTLHITNGDSAAATMRTFLTDRVIITADPLFDGPAPEVPDEEWYAIRAGTLAPGAGLLERQVRDDLARSDRWIADTLRRDDEIVLWFEHDLFDQLLVIRTLDRLHAADAKPRRPAQLICIDRFPGVSQFVGLGQLDAEQLSSLIDTKRPITDEQYRTARHAWSAFRAASPALLLQLAAEPDATTPLPYLGDALRRFLEDYPSTSNGLSRTGQAVLDVLDDAGETGLTGGPLFARTQALEDVPFMGDWSLFDRVRSLAAARIPLVTVDPEPKGVDLRGHRVTITEAGRAVRAGQQDAIRLNGIDEWRGGVRLSGDRESPWRWDAARQTLVSLTH